MKHKLTQKRERTIARNQAMRDNYDLILQRDGYACVLCGARSSLEQHHILSRNAWPQHVTLARNRLTLCRRCHSPEIHTKGGRRGLLKIMVERYGYLYPEPEFSQYLREE